MTNISNISIDNNKRVHKNVFAELNDFGKERSKFEHYYVALSLTLIDSFNMQIVCAKVVSMKEKEIAL